MKEHFDHQKAETQREQMRNEIDRMKRLLENNDSVVHKQVSLRSIMVMVVKSCGKLGFLQSRKRYGISCSNWEYHRRGVEMLVP